MKKFLFTALLIAVMAGCGDSGSSSSSGSSNITPPANQLISNEVEIDKTSEFSVTLKNPYNIAKDINVGITLTDDTKLQITNTTCGTLSGSSIVGVLNAGQECTITYTYAPTDLTTEIMVLNVDYTTNETALCNNLTLENLKQLYTNYEVKVINYAKEAAGSKSPELIDIVFTSDYGLLRDSKTYTATKSIIFTTGSYTFDSNYTNTTVTSSSNNCQISGNTMNVTSNGSCNLEFTINTNLPFNSYVKFYSNTKNYTVLLSFDTKWIYESITPSNKILVHHTNILPEQNIAQVINITSPMDYQLQGTNADKFMITPALYDGCTVTASNISLPAGKSSCYVMVDFTDSAKQIDGSYTAQLNLPATASVYNISGDVVNDAVKYFQDNLCSQLQP